MLVTEVTVIRNPSRILDSTFRSKLIEPRDDNTKVSLGGFSFPNIAHVKDSYDFQTTINNFTNLGENGTGSSM